MLRALCSVLRRLSFLTSEIHKGFIPLLYAGLAGEYVNTVKPKLEKRFAWINEQLADRRHLSICPFSRKPRVSNMHNVAWHMMHVEGLVRSRYAPGASPCNLIIHTPHWCPPNGMGQRCKSPHLRLVYP